MTDCIALGGAAPLRFCSFLYGKEAVIAAALYLAWSFLTGRWEITWLVWPIAFVLYGAICVIIKASGRKGD